MEGFGGGIKHPEPQTNIRFTENKKQWDQKILYRAQLDGGVLFMEDNCFTYNFYDTQTLRESHTGKNKTPNSKIRSHAYRMHFQGAETKAFTVAKNATPDHSNYFIGNDSSRWASSVKNYKEVIYENLYPAIDLQVLGMQNSIKYNFIVAPGGNTEEIKLVYEGLDAISIEKKELRIRTSLNEVVEQKPYAYQFIRGRKVEVPCEFALNENTVSFHFPKGYDKTEELVIDPILVFACSSGSTADNFGMTATYDAVGNLYGGGTCFDVGYPVTLGAFDPSYNGIVAFGRTDVVITKFDSSGSFLQYSTYIGGANSTEVVSSLIVGPNDELMLFGATGSNDFPITAGAYDATFSGGPSLFFASNGTEYLTGTDLYVTRFNAAGTALIGSTFVGGTQNEGANSSATLVYNYGDYYRGEIQTDYTGNCYIASCTFSADFPTTPGCFQPGAAGGMDGIVFKLNPTLTALTWSTYLGGVADDGCNALTVDLGQNVYITGGTSSANFPTTFGALSTAYNGGITDGFVTKLRNDGVVALNSTFIGTPMYDQNFLIQLDNNLDVYIVGQTEGVMPVSGGVYSNANSKQYIWQLNNTLSATIFTTNFGNGNSLVNISPSAFLVDTCGNIYVCGWGGNIMTGTATVGMPLTADAHQSVTDGFNFYLMVLAPDAVSLMYATYFGGALSREHVDGGTSRFDKKGIVYQGVCAGCTNNDDFPVTPGSWPNTGANVNHSTNCNMGVFKFDFQAAGVSADANISPNDTLCIGETVNFNNASSNAFNYEWDFGDGSPVSNVASPSHTYNSAGTFDVTLIAFDSTGCIFSDTTYLEIIVIGPPAPPLGNDTTLCQTPSLLLDAENPGCTYLWSTAATTQTITATDTIMYWVTVSNNVCSVNDSITISQFIPPTLGPDTTLCEGQPVTLDATSSGATYLWSTGQITPTINVLTSGQYWVEVDWGVCSIRDTINVTYISYPIVNLPPIVRICPNTSYVLDAGAPATAYSWSSGQSTQSIDVSDQGLYIVTVSNGECNTVDSTFLFVTPPVAWEESVGLCNVLEYTLDAGAGASSYLWSTGETTASITVTEAGDYWVVLNNQGCTISDTINVYGALGSGVLWYPNSFTPNNNGLNDVFVPKGIDITYFHLLIFDRWGELVYETEDQNAAWDGYYKGQLCKQDVYVWKTEYKTKCTLDQMNKKIGHVTLVR